MTLKKQVWTFLAYGMVILSTLLLSWCFWSSWKNMDTSQIISFSSYKMDITNNYTQNSVDERIDPRIAWKIISLYVNRSWEWYEDNIVISLDKLSPSASLEDYVQAAIGGMSYTRWKYQSLAYQKNNLTCQALTIPTVSNTFSISRISPANNTVETLYFVQFYIHKLSEIVTISASTSNKDNVTLLQQMMATISCNLQQKE